MTATIERAPAPPTTPSLLDSRCGMLVRREYHVTLDGADRQRWKEWVDEGVARHGTDKTGRKEFFAAVASFVK